MSQSPKPFSVAIFGSTARRDIDPMSDRDLLMVGDTHKELSLARKKAERFGWSPTCYTWKRLDYSIKKGMLFVEHLKRESRVLTDPENRLRRRLSAFNAKSDYNSTIYDGQDLISILQNIPDSAIGNYWAADVLAVGVRTIGIATLANEGIYSFSFYSILDNLRKIGVLTRSESITLSELRELKTRYRSRHMKPSLSWRQISSFIEIASKRFNIGLMSRPSSSIDIFEATEKGLSANWYKNSRLMEACLFGLTPRNTFENEFFYLKTEIRRMVRHSGEYTWQLRNAQSLLKRHLSTLKKVSEVN